MGSRGGVKTSNNKALRQVLRKLDGSRRRAGQPGDSRRRSKPLTTSGGVGARRRTSFLDWQRKPPYTPIPIEVLKKQVEAQEKQPVKILKKEIENMSGRRRRTKEATLQASTNRAE